MVVKFSCPIRTRSSVKRVEIRLYPLQGHPSHLQKVPFALMRKREPARELPSRFGRPIRVLDSINDPIDAAPNPTQ